MPARRASAAGILAAPSAGRVHRSNGSNHSVAGPLPAPITASPYSTTSVGVSATPQQKMVYVLMNRLKNKLPCYSGITLPDLENDDAIQQTVESLVDIARDSPDIVAWALTELLEKLHKNTDASGYRLIEVLQSQLFILKILSIAMASRWRRRSDDQQADSSKRSQGPPSVSSNPDSPAGTGHRTARSRYASSEQLGSLSPWVEPPPLDDNCARYILSVMVLFLRQAAPPQQRLMSAANLNFNASFQDLESIESIEVTTALDIFHTGPAVPPSIGSYYPKTEKKTKLPSFMRDKQPHIPFIRTSVIFPQHSISYERTSSVISGSVSAMNTLITKFSGRVVYHLSASNWAVVFARIKSKIHVLAGTNEEDLDVMDVRLMTYCWLDKLRLIQLLQELSSLLVNMRREAQVAVAGPLRTALWNWIEYHQEEFNDAQRHYRRLEGTPERVFDLLYSLQDTAHKSVVWPTLTVLLCVSSDRIKTDYDVNSVGMPKSSHGRKDREFAENLTRALLHPNKTTEIAMICALDICRAASRVQPGEDLPLQGWAMDTAHEVKTTLYKWGGTAKAFCDCPDEIDVALVADALVTIFRFLPESESVPILMQALRPEQSDAVKISAIKACITLITDSPRLPWQKSLEDLKARVMPRLYGIYHSSITRRSEIGEDGLMKKANYRPKAKRYTTETLPDRELAIHAIMALWRADVSWFLDGLDLNNAPKWIPQNMEQWQAPSDSSIKYGIARTMRYIMEGIRNSPTDSPAFTNGSAWMAHAGSGSMASFGLTLLYCRTDFEGQRMWMDLAHELLYRFTRTTLQDKVKGVQLTPERAPAFAIAEIAFMVTLTSADRMVSAAAAQCLRLLAGAERQRGNTAPAHLLTEEERSKRYPIYEQLGDPKALVLGRVADQKRIRKLMRVLAVASPAHIAVWEECFYRWCTLNEIASRSSLDPSDNEPPPMGDRSLTAEERQAQWHNLTLFLASFSASCILDITNPHNPTALANIIPLRYLPDQLRVMRDPAGLLDHFLKELLNLLLSDSAQARDLAREALSTEAHPRLFTRIIKELDQHLYTRILNEVTAEITVEYEQLGIFLDQFTTIVKVVVENAHLPGGEDVLSLDLLGMLQTVAGLVTRLTSASAPRLRLKFCALCDSFLERSESFAVRKASSSRMGIADYVIEWAQDPSQLNDPDTVRLQRELNISTLRTASKLFERLELQPTEDQPEEAGRVVARLFIRYSSFLWKMLTTLDLSFTLQDDGKSEATSFSQQNRIPFKDNDLRELIINGLTSLVLANTEFGMKHCVGLVYEPDITQRIVFSHVFARVVAKGINFESPPESQQQVAKHSKLFELIKNNDTRLALAICQVCPSNEADQIINVLLNIFDTRSSLMSLLKAMIDREIAGTENEAALFRSNSLCTRFLSTFARIYGYNYLRNLILPLIKSMTALPPGHSYDLDPAKAPGQDHEQNRRDLELVATGFLDIISASVPAFPSMFREICAHIGKAVNEVWPEAKFSALGAFIFLRFISPAIVNPSLVDVEVPPDPVLRRGLMNIAKIMQNLANNIFFGKEVHMIPLNDFLTANIVNVTRFLSEINKYVAPEDDQDEWLDTPWDETDVVVLHRFFDKHADKVGKELLSTTKPSDDGDDELTTGSNKRMWNVVCNALVDTSHVSVIPQLSDFPSESHSDYKDLMRRYQHRDTMSVRLLFQPAITTKENFALFVLSVSKLDVEALDFELLMYYIFKTLTSPDYVTADFDIIFDWTAFSASSQLPVHWLKFAFELVPSDIRKRYKTSRMLTPNALALKYMRRIYNITNGAAISDICAMHTSTSELLGNYPVGTVLPSLSYAFEQEDEAGEEFADVYMRHNHPMRVPVSMRVAQTHLRVVTLKATPVSNNLSCRATELIPLTEISDVYNISTGHDQYEFIIRKIRHGSTLYFSAIGRDVIVKTIRTAKGNLKNPKSSGSERFAKLSNVVATLLHTGMLNIGSENEELRIGAYELLCSVCTYLDFEGKPVVPTKAAFVPGRGEAFVVQLSEKLSAFAPHLTLDFLTEVATDANKATTASRIACLQYMCPWVKNMGYFMDPTHRLYEHSGAGLRDCVRALIELTTGHKETQAVSQKYIWSEVGKLESEVVNAVLDELMRAAVDGGLGSQRCESVANIMSSLTSINTRGRIIMRLRKVLGKTSHQPSRSLADNVHWNEISCLTRLLLLANYLPRSPIQAQTFTSEGAHLVVLTAGTGQLLMRTSVYGLVVNQLQTVYLLRSASPEAGGVTLELQSVMDEIAGPEALKLFGLVRPSPTGDYAVYDPPNDKQYLETLEQLCIYLVRVMEILAGSKALLNVWRARWMGLVTSSAFQVSPAIQTRAFVALSILATSDVDDDLLYQMLVALKSAIGNYDDSEPTVIVSMLRCIRKVVVALPPRSRYLSQLFWLAVSLIQCSHASFYGEAIQLLTATLERMHEQEWFKGRGVAVTLLDGREPLDEVAGQMDQILGLSFESNFSFALAAIIFKGVRHQQLRGDAETALLALLRITVQSCVDHFHEDDVPGSPICDTVLGYFLALLPRSITIGNFRALLEEAGAHPSWKNEEVLPAEDDDDSIARLPFSLLGISDSTSALFATSFLSAILSSSQGDDTETEMLFNILSDIANAYPDTISMSFEALQEKIKDTFANASNPTILSSASNIFRVAMQDPRHAASPRGSASTLGTVDELNGNGPGRTHLNALEEMSMHGLAENFTFLQPGRQDRSAVIQWTAQLVAKIIE